MKIDPAIVCITHDEFRQMAVAANRAPVLNMLLIGEAVGTIAKVSWSILGVVTSTDDLDPAETKARESWVLQQIEMVETLKHALMEGRYNEIGAIAGDGHTKATRNWNAKGHDKTV
jgi:hypothetical protein